MYLNPHTLNDDQMVHFAFFGKKFGFFDDCIEAKGGYPFEWAVWLMWICLQQILLYLQEVGDLPKTETPNEAKKRRRKKRRSERNHE